MLEFQVEGMTCVSCASIISKAIRTVDPSVSVDVKIPEQTVQVKSNRPEQELIRLIEESGYPVLGTKQIL
ncbi:heavy-metal-associated domain-containing protein [Leptospira sp. 201903071]|uniref:heavy-metal-associated domain-containing protein n=1 Tax=Leptospira ainazelensis TaxID=2810034 RepID=UPI001965011F|nr:heavy-metal-associated domain-containing protein [Leptospira ainazelensis]MBM9502653.1 heavy-metal-associated domain-containing protein [Leptospira ainazelensis]